jgi:hypothetical protein
VILNSSPPMSLYALVGHRERSAQDGAFYMGADSLRKPNHFDRHATLAKLTAFVLKFGGGSTGRPQHRIELGDRGRRTCLQSFHAHAALRPESVGNFLAAWRRTGVLCQRVGHPCHPQFHRRFRTHCSRALRGPRLSSVSWSGRDVDLDVLAGL